MPKSSGGQNLAMAEYRQPTIQEAVEFVLQSLTREYRQSCITHWREKFGDVFANAVEERVKQKWKTKR